MNNLLNIDEKKIIICGIGTNAKILSQIYKKNEIEIIAYLVSNDQSPLYSDYNGIPVYKMMECDERMKNYPVVSSVREAVAAKVKKELERHEFKKIITVEGYKDWIEVLEYFYQTYFKDKNILLDKEIIDINGSRFINGFHLDIEGKYSFLVELGDIILPYYFNDYTVCNEGPYEIEKVNVEEGDVVFDCGANMGLFSSFAINRGGNVYSFEPTPHTREYLQEYKKIYLENMHIYPYALSNQEGETNFYIGSDMNGENSINNLSGTGKSCITVRMTTIDNFVLENGISKVDFIKADIEGAERYMLMGGGVKL